MNFTDINDLIKKRRSVFPPSYNDKEIPKHIIEHILENANYAPTHKLTEPWRFKILRANSDKSGGAPLQRLAAFLVEDYIQNTSIELRSEIKLKKMAENPLRSNCVIAICMQRHEALLPEWEEIAAVSAAVQNMWLTCTAYGIGSYWSSPGAIDRIGDFLNLNEGEKCLGFFYMGYTDEPLLVGKRGAIEDKCVWIEE